MQSTKSKKNNKKSTLFVLTVFLILVIITSILVINETKITSEKIISKSFNALKEVDIDTFNRYNVSNITRNIEEKLNIDEDTISKDVYKDLLKACFSELQWKVTNVDEKKETAVVTIEITSKDFANLVSEYVPEAIALGYSNEEADQENLTNLLKEKINEIDNTITNTTEIHLLKFDEEWKLTNTDLESILLPGFENGLGSLLESQYNDYYGQNNTDV